MNSPKFSILIPTRDRPKTFVHSLASVAAQAGDDFEIVVADNASGPDVKAAVDAVTSCPVTYIRSEEILPMTQNWINGIEACRGEYITVLGDDDGLMPSALQIVRRILARSPQSLVCWKTHS